MSFPVMSLTVKPSRSICANDTPRLIVSWMTGPDTPPRTPQAPWSPNGTDRVPDHADSDGRTLLTLMTPPNVFLPNSALCGPRTNSI
jgi:hypothetical protein